jgi:ABC-type cobalamin/Fe3+-siderophores transport system ATPase subunit
MLDICHLTYCITGKQLLKEVTFSLQPGKLYGILGPNGAGKSTLLKSIAGIWKPSDGRVLWKGKNLHQQTRQEISKTVSLVAQSAPIAFDFKVDEFVAMGRYAHGTDSHLVEESLRAVDAWRLRERLVHTLSGGEKQRVYIARSLATQAPLLLLDEPTTSLDVRHQLDIWHLLQALTKEGQTIAITLHDFTAAKRFCQELIVLHQGCCVAKGEPSAVLSPSLLQHVFAVAYDKGDFF